MKGKVYKSLLLCDDMKIEPQLVIVSGIAATGKSSTLTEVAKSVDNLFILEKDLVNQGSMFVKAKNFPRLPSFETYVKRDNVFPNCAVSIETPFGSMFQIDPKNDFYARHARDQAYVIMGNIAESNLRHGKIPVIDCFVHRQIADGTLKGFMEQEMFKGYEKSLIHFTCSEAECYKRRVARAEKDPHAEARDRETISSRETFHDFITNNQPLVPKELNRYEHLLIDTTERAPKECAEYLIDYIK